MGNKQISVVVAQDEPFGDKRSFEILRMSLGLTSRGHKIRLFLVGINNLLLENCLDIWGKKMFEEMILAFPSNDVEIIKEDKLAEAVAKAKNSDFIIMAL